jgi:hypothetical protein
VPTFYRSPRFRRDYNALTHAQQEAFKAAVKRFFADLQAGHFRPGLRVKGYRGSTKTFEMTWAPDGRALFEYGDPIRPGHPHIIWLRVGTHDIFDER